MKHIHFVGVKGVGMAALALMAKEAGFVVSGSDIAQGFITDEILQKSGITPFVGFDAVHISDADLVITTGAHKGYENSEVIAARQKNIPVWTQGEAVGKFMKGELLNEKHYGISIAGTHGKTTTSAMTAKIFFDAKLDPSWIIGTSKITNLGFGGHFGKGTYFIAEADEYANEPVFDKTPKMLLQSPDILVITNIEHDHPDLYPTVESVQDAFKKLIKKLPQHGILIACGDDEQAKKISRNFSGKLSTYGFSKNNTHYIKDVTKAKGETTWRVEEKHKSIVLSLSIAGEHNVLNATAAYIVGKQCGISDSVIQKSLSGFHGSKRRMEYIGQLQSGALLYDDYAHHPTEIRKTLQAFRDTYPEKKIICIFQPHTYSRTKLLFEDFLDSLALADEILLSAIYPSQRELYDSSISSEMLVGKLRKVAKASFAAKLEDVVKYINLHHYGENFIILTMGAGDVYTIANELLEYQSSKP